MSVAGAYYEENRQAKLASIKPGSVVTIYGDRYASGRKQIDRTILAERGTFNQTSVFIGRRIYKSSGKMSRRNAWIISNHNFSVEQEQS